MAKKKIKAGWFPDVKKRTYSTFDDAKTALLLVSVTINVALFVAWLVIKLSNEYDHQVAAFLFG